MKFFFAFLLNKSKKHAKYDNIRQIKPSFFLDPPAKLQKSYYFNLIRLVKNLHT